MVDKKLPHAWEVKRFSEGTNPELSETIQSALRRLGISDADVRRYGTNLIGGDRAPGGLTDDDAQSILDRAIERNDREG